MSGFLKNKKYEKMGSTTISRPEWLKESQQIESLSADRRHVLEKFTQFIDNCLTCQRLSFSRQIDLSLSFLETYLFASANAYDVQQYLSLEHGISSELLEDRGQWVTLQYRNTYGATSVIKITHRP